MKGIFISILLFLGEGLLSSVLAQDFDEFIRQQNEAFDGFISLQESQVDSFRQAKEKEFNEFRQKQNELFAAFLGKPWKLISQQKGIPAPKRPDPVKPTIAPKGESLRPIEVPHGDVIPRVEPKKEKPLDIPVPPAPSRPHLSNISLFNTPVYVSMDSNLRFKLDGVSEQEISRMWQRLSSEDYTPMFEDCARICRELNLNGWATWRLCKIVGEQLLGEDTNEAVVMQTYLMAELGYDAQMVRVGKSRLVMICPADVVLCQINYLLKNNKKYYIWGDVPNGSPIYSYNRNYASATRVMDFSNTTDILLSSEATTNRTFKSSLDGELSVSVNVRKSLIDCYRDMPLINDWSFYARQPMDENVKRQVLPTLERAIQGKNEKEAANILLHFVQTAFNYQTDEEQYKREKTDFKEEPFYYEACDCEDRSILYSELVRSLLGLDVVLLHYPNHLCTAVKFNTPVNGYYVTVNSEKYIICDPTYINSSIGMCMDKFKQAKAVIYTIK